jgi:hypothetical protein
MPEALSDPVAALMGADLDMNDLALILASTPIDGPTLRE